ncbi:tdp2 [Symbiodinium sp. CCMP2592]|nr:tdp2 [Symbiodinium sp. CCMP2592]
MGTTARHVDKSFRQCDEFSQDLLVEKIQSCAKILPKFFDFETDADHRTPDCDMLKISAHVVSYNYGLKRRVLETFRNADCSWMSTRARVAEATNRAEVIKSDCEGREENELKVQGLELFFRFQNDEAGKTKADIVKEIFELMPIGRDTNRAGPLGQDSRQHRRRG